MSDKYDREAALLVCGVDIPVDRKVVKVADALREQGKEIAHLLDMIEQANALIERQHEDLREANRMLDGFRHAR